ncbi:MAG: TonB-dependent receptor, partial [Cytophagales bacterium]|nr:TonB-dependent receptor [Cytophagales bacterium]
MKFVLSLAPFLLCIFAGFGQSRYTVSGYVREAGSRELLIGVNVYLPGEATGTTTNTYGFYSITLPAADSVTVVFSYVGYAPQTRTVPLRKTVELNVDLAAGEVLQEVVVHGSREKVSETPQMSTLDIPIKQIKTIPALLGEKDVLKVLQLMPGVQKGSEGSSGLYVRGGGPDQNLIILDDAVVYNAYHLFGFFSLFNGDALKSVELTKGGFPARYGGRLSSVLEMNMKEGSKEKLHGEGGIGLISSRLTLEGPLQKGKSSFILSGRRTYIDALVRPFIPEGDGGYYFYDLTAKVNHDFGRKDKLYLSGYFGQDRFFVREKYDGNLYKLGFNWGNATGTLRWNHLFNEKLFTNTSLIFSNYRFRIYQDDKSRDGTEYTLDYRSGIRDIGIKQDWDFFPSPRHAFKFGFSSTYHQFTPSAIVLKDSQVNQFSREVKAIDVAESGVYAEDTWRPLDRLRLNAGLRLSHYATQGRQYLRPEPRLAASYTLAEDLSAKASYAQMNQYVHLLSNTGIGLPTDLWVPTTARVAPQQSRQVAAGLAKDFTDRGLQLTLEGYYKKMDNIIGYREGASFLLIEDGPENAGKVNWEDNVTAGQGWSYGAELLLQKKAGRFSGWVGYTLSWTQLQVDELNFGKKYYARYDRRHDLSLVGIYEISPRITLSGTWVYGTGNALTMPLSQYQAIQHDTGPQGRDYYGGTVSDYCEKNSFRMAAYHRLDLGIQFHKKMKRHERT